MDFQLIEMHQQRIAKVVAEQVVVSTPRDALEMIANASYQQATGIIVEEQHLAPGFFDLRSGLAGELLQKCANYQVKLAVVGEFEEFKSQSLQAFMAECNRGTAVFFVADTEAAIARITG